MRAFKSIILAGLIALCAVRPASARVTINNPVAYVSEVYPSEFSRPRYSVMLLDPNSRESINLTPMVDAEFPGEFSNPTWSPDGQALAYSVYMGFKCGVDIATNAQPLIHIELENCVGYYPIALSWSIDSNTLVYMVPKERSFNAIQAVEIWIWDRATKQSSLVKMFSPSFGIGDGPGYSFDEQIMQKENAYNPFLLPGRFIVHWTPFGIVYSSSSEENSNEIHLINMQGDVIWSIQSAQLGKAISVDRKYGFGTNYRDKSRNAVLIDFRTGRYAVFSNENSEPYAWAADGSILWAKQGTIDGKPAAELWQTNASQSYARLIVSIPGERLGVIAPTIHNNAVVTVIRFDKDEKGEPDPYREPISTLYYVDFKTGTARELGIGRSPAVGSGAFTPYVE